MEGEKPKGLSNVTVGLMIVTALFFDLLQVLLSYVYMDWLVGIFAGLTFFLWFMMKGVKLLKPKRLAALGGASLVEMIPIPFVASLPAWTAAVIYTALDAKITKTLSKIPGGQIAGSMAMNKYGRSKQITPSVRVDSTERLTPISKDKFDERRRNQKAELDKKTESEKKERGKQIQSQEAWRGQNRKFVDSYGGQEKYDRDLYAAQNKYLKPGERGVIKS